MRKILKIQNNHQETQKKSQMVVISNKKFKKDNSFKH